MSRWFAFLLGPLRSKRFAEWLLQELGPEATKRFRGWYRRVEDRRTAIDEADQIDGYFSAAIIDSKRHLVVWKEGEPVSAYPPVEGDLGDKLRHHSRENLRDPMCARKAAQNSDLTRQAAQSSEVRIEPTPAPRGLCHHAYKDEAVAQTQVE